MVREWTGEHFSRQHHPWQHDRFPDQVHDDNRYADSHDVRRPPIVCSKSDPHLFSIICCERGVILTAPLEYRALIRLSANIVTSRQRPTSLVSFWTMAPLRHSRGRTELYLAWSTNSLTRKGSLVVLNRSSQGVSKLKLPFIWKHRFNCSLLLFSV